MVVSQVRESGGDAFAVQAEVTQSAQVDDTVDVVHKRHGRIATWRESAGQLWGFAPITYIPALSAVGIFRARRIDSDSNLLLVKIPSAASVFPERR